MKPYVIILGNEKGGTGKSTLAMHISVYLLNSGFDVCTIDVDARQGTFSQYFRNREKASKNNHSLKVPNHHSVFKSDLQNVSEAIEEERNSLNDAIKNNLSADFIVIDTPGNNTFLSQLAHSYANIVVTPINESFIDLDVLVRVSDDNLTEFKPSIYAEMLWNQRKERAMRGKKPLDWIVVKNRMSTLYNKNRGDVDKILDAISKRISFRLGDGFCERVIFKELFVSGTTLLDFDDSENQMTMSHVAARQELRSLINFMNIPTLSKQNNDA